MLKKYKCFGFIFALFTSSLCSVTHADYSQHELAGPFVDKMVNEHGFARDFIVSALAKAERQQAILDAISRPAEKTKEWFEYRDIFLGETRIKQGVEFWQNNKEVINKAAKSYGVAPEIIVAILGVETRYGRYTGSYRVIDALTTLGFDYPARAKFFSGQLEQYFLLVREQERDPQSLKGSYAGAMGYGQFIPSSYRHYAVDFDGDNKVDIWENVADAVGSVANYFSEHRWQTGGPVLTRARIEDDYNEELLNTRTRPEMTLAELKKHGFTPVGEGFASDMKAIPLMFVGENGKEFWLGFDNFYVITRYNRSHLYAMAVWELSQEIARRMSKG